jgi:hypothetical protein
MSIGLLNNANNVKDLDTSSKFALVWEGTNKLNVIVEKSNLLVWLGVKGLMGDQKSLTKPTNQAWVPKGSG